jgi:mRNA interferase MazF
VPRQPKALIRRGEVWEAAIPGVGHHPVVIITRDTAIPLLRSLVCVLVTSRFHGHVAEVQLGVDDGLEHESAANCDNIFTLPTAVMTRRLGRLGPARLAEVDTALLIALGLA